MWLWNGGFHAAPLKKSFIGLFRSVVFKCRHHIVCYCIIIPLKLMPEATCHKCCISVKLVKTPCFGFTWAAGAFKASWGISGWFGWNSRAAWPFDLPLLCPHQSLCLSRSKSLSLLFSPPLISHLPFRPFSLFHVGTLEWAPWLQKMPESQAVPQPCLASSFLLLTYSTSGSNTPSAPFSIP